MLSDRLRAFVATRLRHPSEPTALMLALEHAYRAIAKGRVCRPVRIPKGVSVIGIGSAVLGGAGKTPVAIALAEALQAQGRPVALIGHGYRAKLDRAVREVDASDDVRRVGDDALAAARALKDALVPVLVAKRRADAMEQAVRMGKTVLVVDGLLQASPMRLGDAVLVLDAEAPFGSGFCPPIGDLRAPQEALLAAADHVVALGDRAATGLPACAQKLASTVEAAVDPDGKRLSFASLRASRLGLVVAIAHPERVLASLRGAEIVPASVLALADHAWFDEASLRPCKHARVDAWLTTARCATKLGRTIYGKPLLVLEHKVDVEALCGQLFRRSAERA